MIPSGEVKQLSVDLGVPLTYIEKDYVMGWLLWGVYRDHVLSDELVLKGGNCLRKVYFADTRFSDDLDFTAYNLRPAAAFRDRLDAICEVVYKQTGIVFDLDRTRVDEKPAADDDCKVLDGRVYFKGFAGDSSVTMRIKFDVSDYERIVLPTQRHPIIHEYSDREDCDCVVLAYSLEEVLAEKLRSWIQRTRPRDLFDVVKIVGSEAVPISKGNVLSTFLEKTLYKSVPLAGCEEMLFEGKYQTIEPQWAKAIICPSTSVVLARNAISAFKEFIRAVFDPELLGAIASSSPRQLEGLYDFRSGFREAIIEAGRARKLVRMTYSHRDRDIKPYSFRYRLTKKGYAAEYFYGFDRTRGNTIKSFFLHKIDGISLLPRTYQPRWVVEF